MASAFYAGPSGALQQIDGQRIVFNAHY